MDINKKFWTEIKPVLLELNKKINCNYVVFGSTPLYLLNILEFKGKKHFNDLDIVIEKDFIPSSEFREVLFHGNPKQKLYKIKIEGINIDAGKVWPGREEIYSDIFKYNFEIEGIKFASLEIIKQWKELMVKEYNRDKDKIHLDKIEEWKKKIK